MKTSLVLLLSFFTTLSFAARFSNQYCEFELPSDWQCALEGSEWVCQSTNKDRKKEAIIILVAKTIGPGDSRSEYMTYLKQKKTYQLPGGRTQVSEPKYTRMQNINEHQWVDSLHLASEIPGFYTRYLATTKVDLGIAVTFSVSKDRYTVYKDIFDKIIASLKVFRKKALDTSQLAKLSKSKNLIDEATFVPDMNDSDLAINQRGAKKSAEGEDMTFYLILAGALLVFFFLRKKRKK